jgi:hypothetical protein
MSDERRVYIQVHVEVGEDCIDITRERVVNWDGYEINPRDMLSDVCLDVDKVLSERVRKS